MPISANFLSISECISMQMLANKHGLTATKLLILSAQENAVNGDHLWLETNCSGDLCYLGEETCLVKIAVSITWLNRLQTCLKQMKRTKEKSDSCCIWRAS